MEEERKRTCRQGEPSSTDGQGPPTTGQIFKVKKVDNCYIKNCPIYLLLVKSPVLGASSSTGRLER